MDAHISNLVNELRMELRKRIANYQYDALVELGIEYDYENDYWHTTEGGIIDTEVISCLVGVSRQTVKMYEKMVHESLSDTGE